jgi:hypothetical protein
MIFFSHTLTKFFKNYFINHFYEDHRYHRPYGRRPGFLPAASADGKAGRDYLRQVIFEENDN